MATVAVDIDDTLYSFTNLARAKFGEYAVEQDDKSLFRGAYCSWNEWRSPADVIDLEHWLKIIDLCHDPHVIIQQPAFAGAADVLWDLLNQGHSIIYISNRKPEATWATWKWLFNRKFPITMPEEGLDPAEPRERIPGALTSLVCTEGSKHPHIADCQYLIDDRPKTLVEFVYDYEWTEHSVWNRYETWPRLGFGLFGEYNRALTDVPGIYLAPNWALLRHYLVEKEVLHDR